jgi:hypothetical protein
MHITWAVQWHWIKAPLNYLDCISRSWNLYCLASPAQAAILGPFTLEDPSNQQRVSLKNIASLPRRLNPHRIFIYGTFLKHFIKEEIFGKLHSKYTNRAVLWDQTICTAVLVLDKKADWKILSEKKVHWHLVTSLPKRLAIFLCTLMWNSSKATVYSNKTVKITVP